MTTDAPSDFAALLRRSRLAAGLSQEALAEAAGLSARAIRALERGERTAPYRDTVALLATALKLPSAQRAQLEAASGRSRGAARSSPVDRAMTDPPLPVALTSFVGREQEIGELCALLAQPAVRLVTLTGPGGVGKTRLAMRLATEVTAAYDGGIVFVSLAALTDPALVPGTVAAAFGIRPVSDRSLLGQLATVLRSRRCLLVLDNCEHLVEGCARWVDGLLRACPRLQVLATSRQALGIDGEHSRSVRSLSTPPADGHLSLDALAGYEAVRLFCERARLVKADFALSGQNASAVREVCRRLDGMPLALELAAARLPALGVQELARRLDDCFHVLSGGSRVAVPRQQTLRATLDWSYDLLEERERTLFRRLSVFVGSFTLAAAEAVCSGDGIEGCEVLDLLVRLVAQSLVLLEERPEGVARYRLLETVRQYARERLEAGGELAAVADRHASYYAQLAHGVFAAASPQGLERSLWTGRPHILRTFRLDRERDQLHVALAWLVGREATEKTVPILAALYATWAQRGTREEGLGYYRTVLNHPAMAPGASGRAALLWLAAQLAHATEADAEARSHLEAWAAEYRPPNDSLDMAMFLDKAGIVARELGDLVTAQGLLHRSAELFLVLGEPLLAATGMIKLGEIAHMQGEYARARWYYERGLQATRQQQDAFAVARAHHHLGALALDTQEYPLAGEHFTESLVSHRRYDHRNWFQYVLADFAELAAAEGRAERALRLGAAVALCEAYNRSIQPSERGRFERWLDVARSALGEEAAAAAWAEGEAMTVEQALDYAQERDA